MYSLDAYDEQECLLPGWVGGPGRRRHLCAAAITEARPRAHKEMKVSLTAYQGSKGALANGGLCMIDAQSSRDLPWLGFVSEKGFITA